MTEGWAKECGLWMVFEVLAAVGQAMELAQADVDASTGEVCA